MPTRWTHAPLAGVDQAMRVVSVDTLTWLRDLALSLHRLPAEPAGSEQGRQGAWNEAVQHQMVDLLNRMIAGDPLR